MRPPKNPRLPESVRTPVLPRPPHLPGFADLKRARAMLLSICAGGWLVSAAALEFSVGITTSVLCGACAWFLERAFRNSLRSSEKLRSWES